FNRSDLVTENETFLDREMCLEIFEFEKRRDHEASERRLLLFVEEWKKFAVTFFTHFFEGNKMERRGVDGVALVSRRRSIIKQMAQMRITNGRANFDPVQSVRGILF